MDLCDSRRLLSSNVISDGGCGWAIEFAIYSMSGVIRRGVRAPALMGSKTEWVWTSTKRFYPLQPRVRYMKTRWNAVRRLRSADKLVNAERLIEGSKMICMEE